jgi:hypothetical protein
MAFRIARFRSHRWTSLKLLTPQKLCFRTQSTQAVLKPEAILTNTSNKNLDDVFEILKEKGTAWNHPGSAEFDFRSKLMTFVLLAVCCPKVAQEHLAWRGILADNYT